MSDTASDAGSDKELDLSNVRPICSSRSRRITAVMRLRTRVKMQRLAMLHREGPLPMHGTDQARFYLHSPMSSRSSKQQPTSSTVRPHPCHKSHSRPCDPHNFMCACLAVLHIWLHTPSGNAIKEITHGLLELVLEFISAVSIS